MTKQPGRIVLNIATEKKGRTFNSKGLINDKVPVYYETECNKYSEKAVLCDPANLRVIGFID